MRHANFIFALFASNEVCFLSAQTIP